MSKLVCIKHANVDSQNSPELSCKTCCTIFVNGIRQRRSESEEQATEWTQLQQKLFTSHQQKI